MDKQHTNMLFLIELQIIVIIKTGLRFILRWFQENEYNLDEYCILYSV